MDNKYISSDFLKAIQDSLIDEISNEDKAEIIMNLSHIDFDLYQKKKEDYIVLNLSKYIPDKKKIFSLLSKEIDWEEKEGLKWLEDNFESIWIATIMNFDSKKEIIPMGDKFEYIGFKLEDIKFEIDLKIVEKILDKKYKKEIESYIKDYELEELEYSDWDELSYDINEEDLIPSISIDTKDFNDIILFNKDIDSIFRNIKTDKDWINLILEIFYLEN